MAPYVVSDLEKLCSVIDDNYLRCMEAFNCKNHTKDEQRAVPGRSLPLDMLRRAEEIATCLARKRQGDSWTYIQWVSKVTTEALCPTKPLPTLETTMKLQIALFADEMARFEGRSGAEREDVVRVAPLIHIVSVMENEAVLCLPPLRRERQLDEGTDGTEEDCENRYIGLRP